MADYKQQQMADAANAMSQKRKADTQKQMADATAEEETARYDRALQNKSGAGRGKQGGPTAEQAQKAYAKGGSVSSRADGVAQRGKTKGRMC